MSATIDQKEYLKKYLSGNKNKVKIKKSKKKPVMGSGVTIIDDDIDTSKLRSMDDAEIELMFESEDAPQIAAIVDERSEEMKRMHEVGRGDMWKVIGETKNERDAQLDSQALRGKDTQKNKSSGFDFSPSQRKDKMNKKRSDNITQEKHDKDLSPPRKKNLSSTNNDADLSPPRRGHRISTTDTYSMKPNRTLSNEDLSPPRKRNKLSSDTDLSPQRRRNKPSRDRNFSPPKQRNKSSPDTDLSRRRYKSSPPRSRNKYYQDKDFSPQRQTNNLLPNANQNLSPPRKKTRDLSPPKKKKFYDSTKVTRKSRWDSEDIRPEQSRDYQNDRIGNQNPTTTLDGKRAGLQNAKSLAVENREIRAREDEMFAEMSHEVSGRNSKPVVRNRGKRETSSDREAQREREERQKELDDKYAKWGKGLKQSEAHDANVREYMHEANKPVARYKGDTDLEQILKNQEREGDPMLEYLRNKGKGQQLEDTGEERPIYKGAYPLNRFNIRPGYRWDGVDRSNGYEKKYFESKNKKIAQESEAYKWSTEDM